MACPFCQKGPVWYSHSLVKGFVRMLLLSPKRYCFACDRRWHKSNVFSAFMALVVHPRVLMVALCLLVGFFLALLGNVGYDPVRWFKTYVRNRYDRKYGQDSQKMMWKNLGRFYKGRGSAEADYVNHPQERRGGGGR